MMRIKIRVYNPYDLDIIALSEAKNFSVSNAMKQTLKYYAAGKRYLVEIPDLPNELKNDNYVKGFYVELDDTADAQAVEFIKSVPDGLRNAFMKNIFRASFEVCPMSLFMENGANYVKDMINNPRYGKYPVQREVVDPVFLAEGEVGATISDENPDVSKLSNGQKAVPQKQQKPEEDSLRSATESAYRAADKRKKKLHERQQSILDAKSSDELDDLLDSMM